jgi:hypothetical protein
MPKWVASSGLIIRIVHSVNLAIAKEGERYEVRLRNFEWESSWVPGGSRKIWEDSFEMSLRYVNSEEGRYIGNAPNGGLVIAGI